MIRHNILFLGVYVPVTMNGNIIVDGVLASCYPSVDHDLAHFRMTPLRWFPEATEWIFGQDNGWQVFVKITVQLEQYLVPYLFVYKDGV